MSDETPGHTPFKREVPLEDFFTTADIAEMFHVTGETVRSWLVTGKLKGRLVNNRWRVPRSEVIAFGKHNY